MSNEIILNQLNNTDVVFMPHHTAINSGHSYTATMLLGDMKPKDKVLDYGCGVGRNMKYIASKTEKKIHGIDIIEQLDKEKNNHDELRKQGHVIELREFFKDNYYDKVLCSYVLNVVDCDNAKQSILNDIYSKLKIGGRLYLEVRTERDIINAKTREKYKDGWKIKKGKKYTYQEGITEEKMCELMRVAKFNIDQHIINNSKHIVIASK